MERTPICMGEVALAVSADLWKVGCKCGAEIPVSLWKATSALQGMVFWEAPVGFQEPRCNAETCNPEVHLRSTWTSLILWTETALLENLMHLQIMRCLILEWKKLQHHAHCQSEKVSCPSLEICNSCQQLWCQ